jgi:hypothetical protein
MSKQETPPSLWLKRATGAEDMSLVFELRERIYRRAGKDAETGGYRNALDGMGDAFLLLKEGKAIGTFSLCDLSRSRAARELVSAQWETEEGALESAIYIYFLGVEAGERRAEVLKFVFGEIFKYLVRHRLRSIYVLADARLTRRYRWLGLLPVGQKVLSVFPKSGWLSLLHTRQVVAGVYGLHADPVRWNWYLRAPTAELLREGAMPRPILSRGLFHFYSLFAPFARAAEALAAALVFRAKEKTPRRPAHVRPL